MKSIDDLINSLKSSKKNYTEDQINEIVSKYKSYLDNKKSKLTRSSLYKEVADLIGVASLSDVRFYKIMNISAVVVRNAEENKTKVAFSFYNMNDLINDCTNADKVRDGTGDIIWNNNNIPMLHQITISRAKDSCLWTAKNYHNGRFVVEFNDLRVSELAVYEAFVKLNKERKILRYYNKLDLDCHIVSLSELRRREATNMR